MFDIGIWEFLVIGVLGLLVFGPDRLPKAAADAGRMLRQARQAAASARDELVEAAGLQDDEELTQSIRELRDLDPRRAVRSILTDPQPAPDSDTTPPARTQPGHRAPGRRAPDPGGAAADGSTTIDPDQSSDTAVSAASGPDEADPDWT